MKKYLEIIQHYEKCLSKYGDTHKGVDWPDKKDALKRYEVMLDILKRKKDERVTLLDFGCGTAHLYDFIVKNRLSEITYTGLDISQQFISLCKNKYPNVEFLCVDILDGSPFTAKFDYTILNGVFTEKQGLTFDEMWSYFTRLIMEIYSVTNKGIAFNVMSKHVDWERDDLFHVSFDLLAEFLCKELTRNFIIRNDYGLYEYTVYIYKNNSELR